MWICPHRPNKEIPLEYIDNLTYTTCHYVKYTASSTSVSAYARQEKQLKARLDDMLSRQASSDRNFHTDKELEQIIEKYRDKRKLTKKMVDAFVDEILVEKNGSIHIKLRYDDMLKELVDLSKAKEAGND